MRRADESVFRETGARRLQVIASYIERESPLRARTFVRRLRSRAVEIGSSPLAFPLVEGLRKRGVRRRVVGAYLIFYETEPERVVVLRILHGARDYEDAL